MEGVRLSVGDWLRRSLPVVRHLARGTVPVGQTHGAQKVGDAASGSRHAPRSGRHSAFAPGRCAACPAR
eukprot:9663535-Lingulodinium_polyedra.AAC.1